MWQELCFCNFFQNHFFNPTNIISITTFVWQTLHGGDQCVSLDTYLQLLTGIFPTAFKQALNRQVSVVTIQLRLRYSQSLKPCKLQKPIPNHQSSFCWIYLPLLTLSIIRSSCAPSHYWTSLGFHFAGLNPISLVGISGWPGEGRYLVVFLATPTLQHDFTIQLSSSTIAISTSVRKLGVIFDDQLTFKEHIAKIAQSCRFALHNIRKIRPFLTEHAAQLLVQALVISRLDYCNPLLGGLPSNTIKPLQMIQNAAARLVFNEPKRAHVTPLFISLHWLLVAARIQFKTLMLAYRTTTGSAPSYCHSLLQIYIPSRSLRSDSEQRLVVASQRGSKSLSRTFSFTVPVWWNDLPTPIRNTGSLSIFKLQLKTHLFWHYLTSS